MIDQEERRFSVMEFITKDFLPVLFGNDINVYSVARAFYEAYQVKARVFGKALMGTCYKSKLVDFTEIKNLDTPEILLEVLNKYAAEHADKKVLASAAATTMSSAWP